eukprot:11124432-Ditylum_brightwellii.AAC.1
MGFICSIAAMVFLYGGEFGGCVDAFDMVVVLVLEKKKEEDMRRVHIQVRKLFLKGLVWEEKKMLSFREESVLINVTVFPQEDKEQERQKRGYDCRRLPWPCPVVDKVKR